MFSCRVNRGGAGAELDRARREPDTGLSRCHKPALARRVFISTTCGRVCSSICLVPTEDDDRWVTVRDAAAVLGVNAETVRRWAWSGKVRSDKVGSRLMLFRADLNAAGRGQTSAVTLRAWIAERDQVPELSNAQLAATAADLVIEDRKRRWRERPLAGR